MRAALCAFAHSHHPLPITSSTNPSLGSLRIFRMAGSVEQQRALVAPAARVKITRRVVQVTLGLLWLLDGLLQLQPFMFTPDFAQQVLAPVGVGQPAFVSVPVAWCAALIGTHSVVFNAGFALVQISLGAGILVPRFVKPALVASIGWSIGVWYLGEGLGGIAGGHASPITGAPGAVLLYLILAVAAMPVPTPGGVKSGVRLPAWIATAWALLWFGFAVMLVLPGAAAAERVAGQLQVAGSTSPGWLVQLDLSSAAVVTNIGFSGILIGAIVCTCIGVAAFGGPRMRITAVCIGSMFAIWSWVVGQSFGSLFSGQATDPNTGPLLVLFGVALLGVSPASRAAFTGLSLSPPQLTQQLRGVEEVDCLTETG